MQRNKVKICIYFLLFFLNDLQYKYEGWTQVCSFRQIVHLSWRSIKIWFIELLPPNYQRTIRQFLGWAGIETHIKNRQCWRYSFCVIRYGNWRHPVILQISPKYTSPCHIDPLYLKRYTTHWHSAVARPLILLTFERMAGFCRSIDTWTTSSFDSSEQVFKDSPAYHFASYFFPAS